MPWLGFAAVNGTVVLGYCLSASTTGISETILRLLSHLKRELEYD